MPPIRKVISPSVTRQVTVKSPRTWLRSQVVGLFLLLSFLNGCSSALDKGEHRTGSSSAARTPLQVEVSDPIGLRASSALTVASLVFLPELHMTEADKARMQRSFDQATLEELTEFSKVVAPKKGDATLLVTVRQFVQRDGSGIGAATPAAFGISAVLKRGSSSASVWEGSYFFDDFALTQNLLRTSEKADTNDGSLAYVSLDQLSSKGFRELLGRLNQDRVASFSAR